MSQFEESKYKELKEEYTKVTKRILKDRISSKKDTLSRYETEIIDAHNNITGYFDELFENGNVATKEFLRTEIINIREKTLKCLGRINSHVRLPKDLFTQINIEDCTDFSELSENEAESEPDDNNSTIVGRSSNSSVPQNSQNKSTENIDSILQKSTDKMASDEDLDTGSGTQNKEMTELEFIRWATHVIVRFKGDPLALKTFVNSVNLVRTVSKNKYNELLKSLVLTKLEGKALESVDDCDTIDEILNSLKRNIKHDSSKVISGRMMTMKLNKLTTQEYSAKAEELAEAMQRALIIEGIGATKAKEMVVEKTVEMCRQSARTDLVRSVLASSKFDSPKDAIAKLITEQATNETEKQVLAYRTNFNRNKPNFRGNYRNFNRNSSQSFNRNGNSNGRNFHRGNSRGNPSGARGRGGYHNRNYRNNYGNNFNVRVAENGSAPTEERGAQNNNTNQQQASIFTLERLSR